MEDERKLLRDLNLMEILIIRQCLHKVSNRINIGEHTVIRGKQKYISNKEILDCIRYGYIVEFHLIKGQCRVLLRHKRKHTTDDVCVVVNILNGKVITAYTNNRNDKHNTLKEEFYNPDLDVIDTILTIKK